MDKLVENEDGTVVATSVTFAKEYAGVRKHGVRFLVQRSGYMRADESGEILRHYAKYTVMVSAQRESVPESARASEEKWLWRPLVDMVSLEGVNKAISELSEADAKEEIEFTIRQHKERRDAEGV